MKAVCFSLALLWSLAGPTVSAKTYHVYNEADLTDAVSDYKTRGLTSGLIELYRDITLTGIVEINGVSGLVLDGGTAQYELTLPNWVQTASYKGTVALNNCTNVTIRNMHINTPSKQGSTRSKRAVSIANSDKIGLHNLVLSPSGQAEGAVAIIADKSTNVGIQQVTISGFYGAGIVLRQVWGFLIKDCSIINMNNGAALGDGTSNVGIQVDSITGWSNAACTNSILPESQYSGKGMITGNTLENLPGQGIFLHTANDVVVNNNDLTDIGIGVGCEGDCGGRGIYAGSGSRFWIKNNRITGVDNGRSGGGINAGGKDASDVWIQNNTIKYAGNSDQVSAGSLGSHQGDWNGFGISVRERALVEGNQVLNASTYGILIQPNADEVTIRNNTVRYSVLDNIKAVAGFTYTGKYVVAPNHCDGEHWSHELGGPLRNIYIRDNFIADSTYGHGVNIVTRARGEMAYNAGMWRDSWSKYDVYLRNLSMHRNGSGTGVYFEQPTTAYGTYDWTIATSGYNGHGSRYAVVESGGNLQRVTNVNWNNQLSLNLSNIQYPAMSASTGVITSAVY
ncbi:right-handed parallel beta-helix repeat-containing protein [Acanthopleuribacter pedis]|uniref:Right-handed parallel beta-helix repeat-containing protein n=1 Tax=Acanthopleuribacter pedis TaxID=442870 RepID=A0A8J7QIM7_9BACT|nr:right-handed parallel beta-helix repeat-containing protein [Acanthopleuribacter pedis]MBO1321446.1 right-handed parallel beta-helix repeat-containing protein [Acanthopleuribacter pedis]